MKLLLSKLIAILFAFILFNSNVIASTFEIKKNRLLLARRVRMNRMEPGPTEEKVINTVKEAKEVKEVNEVNKVNKVKTKLNKAEFVINALASTGIPVISTVVSAFRFLFEAKKNMKENSFHVKVEGLEDRSYPCNYKGIGEVYSDVKIQAQQKAVAILKQAKLELEVACLNFGIEYTKKDQKLCYDIQAKLKELEKTGKKLVIPKVIENLKKFIDDERSYKVKLKKRPGAILNGEYHLTKLVFKKEGIIGMRDLDDQEEFFAKKSNEIYNKLLNQHNEGLNLIYIAKGEDMFGILRNFNCKNIVNDVSDAEKIGIAVKLSAIWTAGGFMKQCITEVQDPVAKWKFILGIVVNIIDVVLGIVLSIFTFGVWKYIRTSIPAIRSLYYFFKAYNVKKKNPDNSIHYSRSLGKGVGYLVNIVVTALEKRRRLLK